MKPHAKKLIESALPLDAINKASAREKSIRHGHPSTLHLWWARRPLAAARAVLWASLVDDPSAHPELFPTEEAQNAERQRLHDLLAELVKWENSNNEELLAEARAEIRKSMGEDQLVFLDPFAGGGSIPLEAQRLGLEAHAHDLNPVAVMINKAMIEIPPRFAGTKPVNPEANKRLGTDREWKGASGLAEDVRYYGEWMKKKAFRRIGHLYPKVELPAEQGGGEATVIAWIWARTVTCPNPACGCDMPLVKSFALSTKKGNEAWVEPHFTGGVTTCAVHHHGKPSMEGTVTRSGAVCACCGATVPFNYIREQGQAGAMSARMMAVVAEGVRGRLYLTPDAVQVQASDVSMPEEYPDGELMGKTTVNVSNYGLHNFADLFTPRQLTMLITFSDLVAEAQLQATEDARAAGMADDGKGLAEGGCGATAYGQAVGVYLAFVVDKLADYHSSICSWHSTREVIGHTFTRQAVPMVWDYVEGNPFCSSSGCFNNMLDWVVISLQKFPASRQGSASQHDAQTDCGLHDIVISSDPPYYDNIGYADLADFFYIWMRHSLKKTYPSLFRTIQVPKAEELVATPYRFAGSKAKARNFFEDGMLSACKQMHTAAREDVPVTIYYAYKQSETDDGSDGTQASTGWETMLSAIIKAGFAITGTWPMRTEMANRSVASNTNALASSIVLVCRKRPASASACPRRNFLMELKKELRSSLKTLQASNIAPVDMAQAAIGPGMAVYSRYVQVLEADGTAMTVRKALQLINQELDAYFTEQEGALDEESRFCVTLYGQYGFNDMQFGDADVLARAKNTSVERLANKGLVVAGKGIVHLQERDDLPELKAENAMIIWLLTQQLTKAMESGGIAACANLVSEFGDAADSARELAYRLFSLADRKGWSQEAYAYNALVVSWSEIQLRAKKQTGSRMTEGDLLSIHK